MKTSKYMKLHTFDTYKEDANRRFFAQVYQAQEYQAQENKLRGMDTGTRSTT